MGKNFERELPEGYKLVYHIDAKNKKTAIGLSIGAALISIAVFLLLLIPVFESGVDLSDVEAGYFFTFFGIFALLFLAYIILHELTHGAAYKLLTGEKLTFGVTLAVAFCGVPNIYTYRKCALIALVAPLISFTVILIPVLFFFAIINPLYYIGFAFLFSQHLGGCVGDGYMTYLMLVKFRDKRILMRDTGPEQWIYAPKDFK